MHNLLKRLQQHAKSDAIALRSPHSTLSYRHMWTRVDATVQWLSKRSETRLALALDNVFDWVIWDLACLRLAKVLIPIPPFFSAEQQHNVLKDSGAQLLVGDFLDKRVHAQHVIACVSAPTGFVPICVLSTTGELAPLPPTTQKITYTSGSTGQPKGVCLSAEGIGTVVTSLIERLPSQLNSTHLVVMPLAVLLENIAGIYVTLALGAEVVLLTGAELGLAGTAGLNAARFIQCLIDYRISTLVIPPALLDAVCASVANFGVPATQFEFIAVGGAKLAEAQEQRAMELNLPVVVGYGLSECASVVALNDVRKASPIGSVGQLLPHITAQIRAGELFILEPLMLGYLGDNSAAPAWFATGDLAHFDESGDVYIDGRKKHIIVTSYGRNVDPEWVEAALLTILTVKQVCVSGSESHPLRALIVSDVAQTEIERAVKQVNATLPDYARIQTIEVITSPFTLANQLLTGTGRLRRQAILQQYPLSTSSMEYVS